MSIATWVRAHYDRVAVVAGALFLLGSLLIIVRNVSQLRESSAVLELPLAPKAALPPANAIEIGQAAKRLHHPAQWTFSGRSGLFVPEKHFIGANGFPTTLQGTQVHPPVPNEWLEEFGLPITEGDVLARDSDADGFTNLEEWHGHTSPADKKSHPAFVAKLKLKSFVQEPFRLVFASRIGETFAINTNDLKEPTQFLRLGDSIRGTKFKLTKFTEKQEPNRYGTKIDVSELTLENQETREQFHLVKEKIMISPEPVAHFVYSWNGLGEFEVRKDQEFSLKPDEQIKYKLVDVQSAKAVIVNTREPNELIEIGLLTP